MKYSPLFFSIFFLNSLTAQIDVVHEPIIPYFIEQVVADATFVTNVQVNGVDFDMVHLQAGTFVDPGQAIGLGSGIILGTGNVVLAEEPNIYSGGTLAGDFNQYSDADLESMTNVTVNDQMVLEFDFVALGDTVYMEYVFASEEYPEYACSAFNDVFAVFLSGPNPDGGDYVNTNIAWVPDVNGNGMTMDPVGINSINAGAGAAGGDPAVCSEFAPAWQDYSVFYVTNEDTLYEYDGRTIMLNLLAPVSPGQQYHMKIGTGDGTDTAFDSAVLLGANSFKTTYSSAPVGLDEELSSLFSIFPNPAIDYLTVESLEQKVNVLYEIRDMQGRISSQNVLKQDGRIDISDLEQGIYWITLFEGGNLIHREMIQKQ